MVALEAVEGGHRRRRGQLRAPRSATPPRWTSWSRPPAAPPATPARRATSLPLPEPGCRRPGLGRRALPRRRSGCSPGWSTASPRSSTRPAAPLRLRLATSSRTVWLGTSAGRAQAVGPADGVDRAQRQDPAARRLGVDGHARPPTSPTSTSSRWRRTPRPGSAGGAAGERCPPVATRRCCRRRRCRTSCCMLAWSMGGRPAQEGRSALAGPDGPRVGERLTDRPAHAGERSRRPGAGVRAVRHRAALRRRGQRLRQRRARPARRVAARRRGRTSWPTVARRGGRVRHGVRAAGRQPAAHRRVGRRPRWTTWSPGRGAACC